MLDEAFLHNLKTGYLHRELDQLDDEYRASRGEENMVRIFPETLEYIRNGEVEELYQFLQSPDYQRDFIKMQEGSSNAYLATVVYLGIVIVRSWEGGLPTDRAILLYKKYLREAALLNTLNDMLDCHMRMQLEFASEVRYYKAYNSNHPALKSCFTYILARLDTKIDLNQLAEHCGYTLNGLQRLFKRHLGMTPNEFIRNEKIRKAQFLLEHTNLSSASISNKLAYSSQSYFINQFKSVTGMTPRHYRNQCRLDYNLEYRDRESFTKNTTLCPT